MYDLWANRISDIKMIKKMNIPFTPNIYLEVISLEMNSFTGTSSHIHTQEFFIIITLLLSPGK